jgi:hypothetical protein
MNLNRSILYYQPVDEDPEDLDLMRKMDEEFHKYPTKGVISMVILSPYNVSRGLKYTVYNVTIINNLN